MTATSSATPTPSTSGVPLRLVVGLGLLASVLARCITPALPGLMVGIDAAIKWSQRFTSLLTLLAATGLVAGLARLCTLIASAPRAPLAARLLAVPAVAMGCLLLLFASFRPLEPLLALMLGLSSALVGGLSARHMLGQRDKRAAALVLALVSGAGLIHVMSRKLTQDASDAANVAAFRTAQWIETLGLSLDLLALALTLAWLQRRALRGRVLVPLVLLASGVCVVLSLRGVTPGAGSVSVLLSRALDKLGRDQSSLLPLALTQLISVATLLAAAAALLGGGGEIGLVLAGCLAARGSLDIPIPALMLELAALYLPFTLPTQAPASMAEAPASDKPPLAPSS